MRIYTVRDMEGALQVNYKEFIFVTYSFVHRLANIIQPRVLLYVLLRRAAISLWPIMSLAQILRTKRT
jgi:hypothetical protein